MARTREHIRRRLGLAAAAAALAVLGGGLFAASPTEANTITSYRTEFATDVTYAGLGGLRGVGSGSITVSGVTGTVTGATLYWHGPTNGGPNVIKNITFAGSPVTGTPIGQSADNCWDFANSQAYRADVSALVTGNGAYTVSDLIKASADINGVGLIVFFDDGNPANDRDVVMFDGNDSNVASADDAEGWDVSLPGIDYTSGTASLDLVVADGQNFPDDDLVIDGNTVPGIFNGDTVPAADAGSVDDVSGGLWDQRSYDITADLSVGPNTVTLTTGLGSDCLSLIVAAVNLPAGSAPNQPEICDDQIDNDKDGLIDAKDPDCQKDTTTTTTTTTQPEETTTTTESTTTTTTTTEPTTTTTEPEVTTTSTTMVPSTTLPPSPPTTGPAVIANRGEALPRTGGNPTPLVLLGVALAAAGAVALRVRYTLVQRRS